MEAMYIKEVRNIDHRLENSRCMSPKVESLMMNKTAFTIIGRIAISICAARSMMDYHLVGFDSVSKA